MDIYLNLPVVDLTLKSLAYLCYLLAQVKNSFISSPRSPPSNSSTIYTSLSIVVPYWEFPWSDCLREIDWGSLFHCFAPVDDEPPFEGF